MTDKVAMTLLRDEQLASDTCAFVRLCAAIRIILEFSLFYPFPFLTHYAKPFLLVIPTQ